MYSQMYKLNMHKNYNCIHISTVGWYLPGGYVLVTEFRDMALNGLLCADVLRPLDLVPLSDFTYKYHLI